MQEKLKNKRNMILGSIVAMLFLLVIAYGAFKTILDIEGTASIDSRWDVHIKDNGVSVKSATMATSTRAEKDSQLTASFACNLTEPGVSTISYDIIVENSGTFGAKLSSINLTGTTAYIDATTEGIEVGDVIAGNGGIDTLTVTVSYKNVNTVPTGEDATANITVTLNYIQDDESGGGSTPASPTVINGRTIDQTFVPQYYRYSSNNALMGTTDNAAAWTTDPTTLNKDYYLGQDIEITSGTTGTVIANYACFVINNTQYCLRGSDGINGPTYYAQNKALLSTLESAGIITCSSISDSSASCSAGSLERLNTDTSGEVSVGISYSSACWNTYNGYSHC